MNFDDRVAAVGIATQFQEQSNEVFKLVEEETELAKTQVLKLQFRSYQLSCKHDVTSFIYCSSFCLSSISIIEFVLFPDFYIFITMKKIPFLAFPLYT